MASEKNTFRPEASSQTVSELLSQLTETWKKREEYLWQKVTDNEAFMQSDLRHEEEIEVFKKKYEMLDNNLQKTQNEIDKQTESLKKKIEVLEDDVQKKVNYIDEMKKVNDQYMKKIREYKRMFSDFGVRVLSIEKLGNELLKGSGCSPVDLEVKKPKNVAAESSRLPPPPGFEEIVPKPKKITESKLLEIIEIDDDDDDDDNDLINNCSSKRQRVSDSKR